MNVEKSYGMIHPGDSDPLAVRATFIIDPKGIMKEMVYYAMSNGSSI
jgi:peroxiredoxin (alkyl hydroperoxide reductase subunit C)